MFHLTERLPKSKYYRNRDPQHPLHRDISQDSTQIASNVVKGSNSPMASRGVLSGVSEDEGEQLQQRYRPLAVPPAANMKNRNPSAKRNQLGARQ